MSLPPTTLACAMTPTLSRISVKPLRLATIVFCAAILAPKLFDASAPLPMAGTRAALQLLEAKPLKSTVTREADKGDTGRP